MTEPTRKSEGIEEFLKGTFGFDRRDSIKEDMCVPPPIGCGKPVNHDDWDTEGGRREYAISGMCPDCQRKVFGQA